MRNKRALISVWDKEGLEPLTRRLVSEGYEIISSSGTAGYLKNKGIEVTEVTDLTGFPPILGGRVKTMHPKIVGGILARRGEAEDEKACLDHGIASIDLVVCTLYPFEEKARNGEDLDDLIETIDIGGITLIRSAAKNYYHVAVVTNVDDYPLITEALEQHGELPLDLRQSLALKAFSKTSYYDAVIFEGLKRAVGASHENSPDICTVALRKEQALRYGENPHQQASLYLPPLENSPFIQLSGKELSYNNLLDLDTILRGCSVFQGDCACIIVKHTSPCGTAAADNVKDAFTHALAGDPVSAFGGIVGFTRAVDMPTALLLEKHFFEVVAAPSFQPGVQEYLSEKKSNLRLLLLTGEYHNVEQITANRCGFLVQQDLLPPLPSQSQGRWIGPERTDLWNDLLFAWKTVSIAKSNAIAVVKNGASLGIGGGFTNRVDATQYALVLASDNARGAVLASDAFFPFPDSVRLAADEGIAAIIQPGGSIKDDEVARAVLDAGISMFVGGGRTFRH